MSDAELFLLILWFWTACLIIGILAGERWRKK